MLNRTKIHLRAIGACACSLFLVSCQPMLLSGCAQTGTEGFDVRLDTKTDDATASVTVTKLDQTKEDMENTNNVTSTTIYMNGDFELPLDGAMGISVSPLDMHDEHGNTIGSMEAGCEFTILAESEDDLRVALSSNRTGVAFQNEDAPNVVYIDKDFVLINLPDVIPSIIYENTNSTSSLLSSKGYSIDGLTGTALYDAKYYNERLQEDQYVVPVLYGTAKKLKSVQEQMLKDGSSLKIYESYRPFATQQKIIAALTEAMKENPEINKTITTKPWGKSWFIALRRSNHQRGCAVDTTMVKVTGTEEKKAGIYTYTKVTQYEEYKMPTQIHDMSADSIALTNPVESMDREAWKTDPPAATMTEAALKLQNYMTSNELYPLASEWWHFNDIDAREKSEINSGTGNFYITGCMSKPPEEASVSENKNNDSEHIFSGGTVPEDDSTTETVESEESSSANTTEEVIVSAEGAGVVVSEPDAKTTETDY